MGFGFGKPFVITLFIAGLFAYGFKDPMVGLYIIGWYAIIKVVWNVLTKK